MPTYAYACTSCGHEFDVVQSITEPALQTCEECGGPLRKVFHPVGVTFKGSGFYRTDSRAGGGSASTKNSDGAAKSSDSKSGDSKTKDSKPASSSGSSGSSSSGSSGGSSSSSGSGSSTSKAPA